MTETLDHENKKLKLDEDGISGEEDEESDDNKNDSEVDKEQYIDRVNVIVDMEGKGGNGNLVQVDNLKTVREEVEDMGENGEVELSDTDSKSNDSEEDDDQYIEGDVAKVDLEDQVAALFYILFL